MSDPKPIRGYGQAVGNQGEPPAQIIVDCYCPLCHRPMRLRNGRYGDFWGCQSFPKCRGTRRIGQEKSISAASQ